MHIPDGYFSLINPTTHAINVADVTVLVVTWAVTVPFLVYAWKKTQSTYSQSIAATLAVMSALVFVAQILNFPVAGGTSVHILGGTLLALVLGPFPAMLSMTIVLIMQAVFFADGGLLTFGANALNMAIIGGLSFYLVKLLASKRVSGKRFAMAVFTAAFASSVLSGLFTGVEVGFSQTYAGAGGLSLTVPAMLVWYSVVGLAEAFVTMLLIGFLGRVQPAFMVGLRLLHGGEKL